MMWVKRNKEFKFNIMAFKGKVKVRVGVCYDGSRAGQARNRLSFRLIWQRRLRKES